MQSYSSQPQAAPSKRKTYREDEGGDSFNLMNDPRVVRGSTFAPKVLTMKSKQDMIARTKTVSTRRNFSGTKRSSTPPPVEGRVHMDLQTDDFLDELTDKPVECDAATQTQAILDRPPSPLFIRAKTGKDVATEILENELFDFDSEVFNMLEVLVGKTMHVAMLEVMQEEELENIQRQQKEFETIRNVELVEVQRLENEEKRKLQEKDRRVEQEKKRLQDRKQLENKIAAKCFAQQYLTSLHNDVFDELESQGVFFDPVRKEVEDEFLTPLIASMASTADRYAAAKGLMDDMLGAAFKKAKQLTVDGLKAKAKAAEAAAKKAEQEAAKRAEEAAAAAASAPAEGEAPAEE
jgi:radial spoke head protein 3